MANPDEGEVSFKAKGKEYTFCFSSRSLRVIEAHFKKPIGKVIADFGDSVSQDDLFILFVNGLKLHHPDIKDDEADVLLRPALMMKVVDEALTLAFRSDGDEAPSSQKPNGAAGSPQLPSQEASTGSAVSEDGSRSV